MHRSRASTGAEQCDAFGVTAKLTDVPLDPAQRELLVVEAHVAGKLVAAQRHETEDVEAIVHGDENDVFFDQKVGPREIVIDATSGESTARNEDYNGELAIRYNGYQEGVFGTRHIKSKCNTQDEYKKVTWSKNVQE